MSDRVWHEDPRVLSALDEAELLHVAVAARGGPRVTPVVFNREGRSLWFVVARGSVKARALGRRPEVGGLVQGTDGAVLIGGRARLVDPLTVRGVGSVEQLLDLPTVATRFLGRNTRDALGIARGRPVPTLPVSRIAVEVEVTRGAVIGDDRVVARWGQWRSRELLFEDDPPEAGPPGLADLPHGLGALLEDGSEAVVGWSSLSGPVALPARWRGAYAETIPDVTTLAGVGTSGPACITADASGHRLEDKRGVMLSGPGSARLHGDMAGIAVESERLSWWVGDESGAF